VTSPRAAWDEASGIAAGPEEVNYLREMIFSPASGYGIMGSVTVGALISMAMGIPGLAVVPILAVLCAESIAALFIPSSPVFRRYIDQKKRAERRASVRAHLLDKISAMTASSDGPQRARRSRSAGEPMFADDPNAYGATYSRMIERLDSLRGLASASDNALSAADIERLDEATVDYLRLVYARLNIDSRMDRQRDAQIEAQLQEIQRQMTDASPVVYSKLAKAERDLQRNQDNRAQLPARDTILAAQLTTMAETFEELYHRISSDPTAGNVTAYLQEATERLSIEEELTLAAETEFSAPDDRNRKKRTVHAKQL